MAMSYLWPRRGASAEEIRPLALQHFHHRKVNEKDLSLVLNTLCLIMLGDTNMDCWCKKWLASSVSGAPVLC